MVPGETVAGRQRGLRAGSGAAGNVIVLDQVLVRLDEVETVPDTVGFGVPHNALPDVVEQQTAPWRQLAPAMLRVVVVVGEVAAFDEQRPAVARDQTGGKAARLEVANRHVHTAFE